MFGPNDLDETLPAPFKWDVERLVVSFVVAARDNGHRPNEQRAPARATAAAYRTTIPLAATMRFLDVWYFRIDVDELFSRLTPAAEKPSLKAADACGVQSRFPFDEEIQAGAPDESWSARTPGEGSCLTRRGGGTIAGDR